MNRTGLSMVIPLARAQQAIPPKGQTARPSLRTLGRSLSRVGAAGAAQRSAPTTSRCGISTLLFASPLVICIARLRYRRRSGRESRGWWGSPGSLLDHAATPLGLLAVGLAAPRLCQDRSQMLCHVSDEAVNRDLGNTIAYERIDRAAHCAQWRLVVSSEVQLRFRSGQ